MNLDPADPAGTPETAVAALARAMERISHKLLQLDRQVNTLAAQIAARPDSPSPDDKHPPGAPDEAGDGAETVVEGPRCWLLANDPVEAAAGLVDLVQWLDRVYAQYPDSALSSCWLWHPAVVEELWWLRCAHADAYDDEVGSWLRVGDWHDRQRPGVARRVRAVLGKCQLSRHDTTRERSTGLAGPTPTPMAEHVTAIAAAWATHHAMPVPTAEQLDDGNTYQREHLWKSA